MAGGPLGAPLVAAHLLAPRPLRVMTSRIERLVRQLDGPTGAYAPAAGIFRGTLKRPVPFEISLDLDTLTPRRTN